MRYKAFISYSHSDERWGARLHRRLETFRIPRRLVGQETENGPVPKALKPVFRDKVELSAGADLSEALQRRLEESETLIVLCSPNAAKSFWVNEEILYFKRHNNPDNIFAFIIDGEPNAEHPDHECFPEALRFRLDKDGQLSEERAEPLAADARSQGDGERAALLRLVSGMIGVGFDDLVRRDLQRARRRVTGITVTAISAMLVMGALTGVAMDARSEAEARKNDAEGLIEFMLTDLRDKLEPVGRLDALDAVGQKASEYYNQYDLNDLDPDTLGRYATVNHLLGDIQLRMGNINEAKLYFEPVFKTTKRQLEADPNNPDRIYEHIQSVYWVGQPYQRARQLETYLDYQKSYLELAKKLYNIEGISNRAIQEMAYGLSNVGNALRSVRNLDAAEEHLNDSISFYQQVVIRENTIKSKTELASRYSDLSFIANHEGNTHNALKLSSQGLSILRRLNTEHPDNFVIKNDLFMTQYSVGHYMTKLSRFAEAEPLLIELLEQIDAALRLEPDHDGLKKRRLTALEGLIELYRNSGSHQAALNTHMELYSDLLQDEQKKRKGQAFDSDWDYAITLQNIQNRMLRMLSSNEYQAASNLLTEYEDLLFLLKGRKGLEDKYYDAKINYLITKTFLNADYTTFLEIKTLPEDDLHSRFVKPRSLIIALMEYYFCTQKNGCNEFSRRFTIEDLDHPTFSFFQKKYPTFAQDIRDKILLDGEIHE